MYLYYTCVSFTANIVKYYYTRYYGPYCSVSLVGQSFLQALQLITKTLNDGGTTYKVQVQLLERMYDKQKPPSVAVYFSQIQQTPPSSLQHIRKNKALSGKLGNKGSLSDMFREEVREQQVVVVVI